MDIETKIKNFIDYAREVCLQSLLLADNIKVDLKSQDNLYEVERIDNEVISKYENIYLIFLSLFIVQEKFSQMKIYSNMI